MSEVVALPGLDPGIEPGLETIAETLEAERGNVTEAAKRLGVGSAWLRRKIMAMKELGEVMDEITERNVDKAIGIIRQGMEEDSYLVRFYAAKEFLRTEAGRRRGFGQPQQAHVVEAGGGRPAVIVLKWLDDNQPEPKQIEGSIGP
jgi:hypothetical protein